MSQNRLALTNAVLDLIIERVKLARGVHYVSLVRHLGDTRQNLHQYRTGTRTVTLERLAMWILRHNEACPTHPITLLVEGDSVRVERGRCPAARGTAEAPLG